MIAFLTEQVKKLAFENKVLNEKISLLINGGKSTTSSTPPSHDLGRSNKKNSRIITGRKTGGQSGHEGTTLAMKVIPDQVIDYAPCCCSSCGANMEDVDATATERKQEVELPPIAIKYVEHIAHSKTCTRCGTVNEAVLPAHLTAPVQYGHSIAAQVVYLSVYQYLPYKRVVRLFADLYGLPISEGTIDNMLQSSMEKALPVYHQIQKKLEETKVVGADETGCRIGGKKGWIHTWQNETLTFLAASMNRGYATVEKYFPDGFKGIIVSDCWAAQLKTPASKHQLCVVHLLRELTNFIDALACKWSVELKQLLKDAIDLKHQLKREEYGLPHQGVMALEKRLEVLLNLGLAETNRHQKIQAFIKRLVKHKNSIFTFLHHYYVPADNNGAEKAIRNVKVKTKVSGQFRSEKGATRFAVLRSVVDTSIKNAQIAYNAILVLQFIAPPTPT